MKVHPFLTVIQGQKSSSNRKADKASAEPDFAKVLSSTVESTRDVVEVVTMENRLAGKITAAEDMAEAENVLQRAQALLADMKKNDLGSVHRLEGLVHVYTA